MLILVASVSYWYFYCTEFDTFINIKIIFCPLEIWPSICLIIYSNRVRYSLLAFTILNKNLLQLAFYNHVSGAVANSSHWVGNGQTLPFGFESATWNSLNPHPQHTTTIMKSLLITETSCFVRQVQVFRITYRKLGFFWKLTKERQACFWLVCLYVVVCALNWPNAPLDMLWLIWLPDQMPRSTLDN